MKTLLLVLAAIGMFLMSFNSPALAADLANGAKVFTTNCAACHAKGGNVINPAKALKKEVLAQYDMASIEAIRTQVTNGKAAMPSFKGRLTATEIEDVAAYVLDQSEKGW